MTRRRSGEVSILTATLTGSPLTDFGLEYPKWMDQGLCGQTDPEAWFPEKGGSTRDAKRMCARCPVIDECLAYALQQGERHGVWGGKTDVERRNILRAKPRRCAYPGCELPARLGVTGKITKYCTDEHMAGAHNARQELAS